MRQIIRGFLHLLYFQLAFLYDPVAWLVSAGHWKSWVMSIIPRLPPGQVLEIGFGTGHLQAKLHESGYHSFGLDLSAQMVKIASKKLGIKRHYLTRARAQQIPFASLSFDVVTSTFPAPFMFEQTTISEIFRVLKPGGKFVVLLAARPAGANISDHYVRGLFTITHGPFPIQADTSRYSYSLSQIGFKEVIYWDRRDTFEALMLEAVKLLEIPSNFE
jgi:ubiquinone/menaquinone biosynthesis C-methylase UbiE